MPLTVFAAETEDNDPPLLGELHFPTSGSEKVQRTFLAAVELLHNFEYEEAIEVFRECQRLEPDFAMSYWGEAMCLNHPLWGEQDLDAAREVVKKLDGVAVGKLTDREQGFLSSLKQLYGEGEKPLRDQRYAGLLADLAKQHPDDHEIAAFYALALLGTCAGERDVRVYIQAAGILENIYAKNPRHPGVLHYLIHCYDDPVHAPLGLRAARAYAAVAANSAHAKHMPSHIYLPLGMWDEVVRSNQEAWQAGKARLKRFEADDMDYDIHALHALQWLEYGYLQQGDEEAALECLHEMNDTCRANPTPMSKWYLAFMEAAYAVDARDWKRAEIEVDMTDVELSAAASHLFVAGLAAIRNDTTGAERALRTMIASRSAAEVQIRNTSHHHSSYFEGVYSSSIRATRVMETQLEALILLADGKKDQAVERLKDAASAEERLAVGYGPPTPVKPSPELLAEVLLNLDRPEEAQKYYQQCLQRTPRRSVALAGLAEAATRNGDEATARRAADALESIGPGRPKLQPWKSLPFGAAHKDRDP